MQLDGDSARIESAPLPDESAALEARWRKLQANES